MDKIKELFSKFLFLRKYWKVVLSIITLLGVAIFSVIFFMKLHQESKDFDSATTSATTYIAIWAAIGAILAAIYTFRIYQKNAEQLQESQKQIAIGQQQTEIMLATQKDSLRPIIYPSGNITYQEPNHIIPISSDRFTMETDRCHLILENGGPGIAFNIQVALFPTTRTMSVDHYYSYKACLPIPPNIKRTVRLQSQGRVDNTNIPTYKSSSLNAQDSLGMSLLAYPSEVNSDYGGAKDPILGRLTVTFHDVFGTKYFITYDYDYLARWTLTEIGVTEVDLGDIDALNRILKEST